MHILVPDFTALLHHGLRSEERTRMSGMRGALLHRRLKSGQTTRSRIKPRAWVTRCKPAGRGRAASANVHDVLKEEEGTRG